MPLVVYSQYGYDSTITYNYDGYTFTAKYDTSNYCSVLTIDKGGNTTYTSECGERIMGIDAIDPDGNGKKIMLTNFTGGAHCCTFLTVYSFNSGKISLLDTLFLGNGYYEIKDLNNDGKKELVCRDDAYAYAFTSYAGSFYPVEIYKFKNNKFYIATKEYPELIENDIKDLKNELKDYITKGFDCPKAGDDTFNTDAGSVKAILGPIVEDYKNLGKLNDGYDYVKKIYKCNDVVNFISILEKDFKLK